MSLKNEQKVNKPMMFVQKSAIDNHILGDNLKTKQPSPELNF